jgi:hypothetical protein
MHRPLPERVKNWYKNKSNTPNRQFAPSKIKKANVKSQIKTSQFKTKSVMPTNKSERLTQKTKDRLPPTKVISSSKRDREQKRSLPKSQTKIQPTVNQEKRHSKILDTTKKMGQVSVEKKEKMKTNSRISIVSKFKDQRKDTIDASVDERSTSSSTTIKTKAFDIDKVSKVQDEREGINDSKLRKLMKIHCFVYIDNFIVPNSHSAKVIF